MVLFAPFRGITYNAQRFKDISTLVAPPYDVITEDEQDFYYKINPYNVIRLILGKKKRGDTDWDNRYTRAAEYFKRWQEEMVLVRSKHPSLYLTRITYKLNNTTKSRWGLIGLVKIEDDGSKRILPHERTFSAYKEDRLRLMKACSAQLSQIFGLYSDPEGTIMNNLKEKVDLDAPALDFEFIDGTRHKVWIIENDFQLFKELTRLFQDKKIIIADGHHRYETSRNLRDIMRLRFGKYPPNRSYEFVMMYLSNMDDDGLTVLPSHRLIKEVSGFGLDGFLAHASQFFETTEIPFSNEEDVAKKVKELLFRYGANDTALAFFAYNSPSIYIFTIKPGAREQMGDDLHPALKRLDVLVLSRLIFQKILGFSKEDMDNNRIFHYTTDIKKAMSQVSRGDYQMAFLLNPTKIDHIKEITNSSLIMPRKSTYFYPKILTGLVFNKIDPHEVIQLP